MENSRKSAIVIRLAKAFEAPAIADLLYDSFVEYKSCYTDPGFAATTISAQEIGKRVEDNIIWVARCEEVITGTISLFPEPEGILIKSVAVAPTARGKGLGTTLMRHAVDIAEKSHAKYLRLTTTKFLAEAIRLYERFGFEECGHEDLYGTQLIRMKKNVEQASVTNKRNEFLSSKPNAILL